MTELLPDLLAASWETVYMVLVATVFSTIGGIPLGVLLVLTDRHGLRPMPVLNWILGAVVNIGRSIPFILLMVALIPVTRLVTGTTIGSTAAIVPLTIGAIPFLARLVETSLREVSAGTVDAAISLGATRWQVVVKVLLAEALPSLIAGVTVTVVALVSYSAMAGAIGGGGLGNLGITYGYQRFDTGVAVATVVLLLVIVQVLQFLGDRLARKLAHR
ncbi:methionine ABC transporter permease [Fodinicola acaciae]|uniref:methionine ABC transporter permease n=1 Tax=Fodinicola acaciae TaxID=2681555 RepID=UPI0013D8A00C|nr:methionine ABC transporter permease [Fodinicola acaciae]